jgi:hypothetical protein
MPEVRRGPDQKIIPKGGPTAPPPFPRWGTALAVLWALFAATAFYVAQGKPPVLPSLLRALLPPAEALAGPFRHAGALAGALLFWVLSLGLGRAALRRWVPLRFNLPEKIGLSLALGAGLLSVAVCCLGAAGMLNKSGVLVVTVLGLGVVFADWRKSPPALPRLSVGALDGPTALLALLAALVLLGTGALALAPARFYDALVYHLALPKLYLLENRWVPTPAFLFGGFPMFTHALFAWALALGDERWAALIHWGFGVGAALCCSGGRASAPATASAVPYRRRFFSRRRWSSSPCRARGSTCRRPSTPWPPWPWRGARSKRRPATKTSGSGRASSSAGPWASNTPTCPRG